MNIRTLGWDDDLCRFFAVPRVLLPSVHPSKATFGTTATLGFLPAGLPIAGVAGDQQAALFGQWPVASGERPVASGRRAEGSDLAKRTTGHAPLATCPAKCTYGTGAFFLQHIGDKFVGSSSGC